MKPTACTSGNFPDRRLVVVEDTEPLPPLYSFEEHQRAYAHLRPSGQRKAFERLPEWKQAEAWLDLKMKRDERYAEWRAA